jgi:hypothetical protein
MTQVSPKTLLDQENPLAMFLYALKAPESKRQYPKRLKVFLDFLTSTKELSYSDLENQCKEFMTKSQTVQDGLTTNLSNLFYIKKNESIKARLFMLP